MLHFCFFRQGSDEQDSYLKGFRVFKANQYFKGEKGQVVLV